MKKRIFPGLLTVLILLVLTGCNPFTTNLYSGIDKYKQPDLNDVDALLDDMDEPQFYENLNEEEKQQVLDTLEEVYSDPTAPTEKQQEAALMAVDVHLKTSDTEETMTNFNSLVGDAVEGEDIPDVSAPEELFRELFGEPPAGMTEAQRVTYRDEVVKPQLVAFYSVCDPLEAYGQTLKAGIPAPPETNAGDTATKALMGGMTRTMLYYIDDPAPIDVLSDYLSRPAAEVTPSPVVYKPEMPDFDGPSDMLVDPADSSRDGLKYVVEDGLGDIDELFGGDSL